MEKSASNTYLATANGEDGYQIVWDEAGIISIDGISKETVTVRNASGSMEAFDVSYLYFTISQSAICQSNALIAVKDGNGNIMWSWHIWTTNDPALLADPIPVTNYTDVEYKFFPLYNIGWIDASTVPGFGQAKIVLQQTESGKEFELTVNQQSVLSAASTGCHYQWGRKDPIRRVDNLSGKVSNPTSIAATILNPDMLYGGSSKTDWLSGTHYYNLWTGKYSGTDAEDQNANMIKTIYDPSPVGYKVPAPRSFTGFSTDGGNHNDSKDSKYHNVVKPFNYGWNFYTVKSAAKTESTPTVFFPVSGIYNNGGEIYDKDKVGSYWSAVPSVGESSTQKGRSFGFRDNVINVLYDSNRVLGFSIRPVKE